MPKEKKMIEINKNTDQNLVCVESLKVTIKTTDVYLNIEICT